MNTPKSDLGIDFTGWSKEAHGDLLEKESKFIDITTQLKELKEKRASAWNNGYEEEYSKLDYVIVNLSKERRSLKAKIDYRVKKGGIIMKRPQKYKYTQKERTRLIKEFETNLTALEKNIEVLINEKKMASLSDTSKTVKDLTYARSKRISLVNKINYHKKLLLKE